MDLLVERAIKWLEVKLQLQTVAGPQRQSAFPETEMVTLEQAL